MIANLYLNCTNVGFLEWMQNGWASICCLSLIALHFRGHLSQPHYCGFGVACRPDQVRRQISFPEGHSLVCQIDSFMVRTRDQLDIPDLLESPQCKRRPFSPSSLHRQQSHPSPIPVTPCIYPANPPDIKGQFSMVNLPNLHIFGLWEESGAPGGNPCRHGENVKTPHRQSPEVGIESGSLVL